MTEKLTTNVWSKLAVWLLSSQGTRAKSKHCSDLGYKILQVRLRREASQGVDNCAYLPENEIEPVSLV